MSNPRIPYALALDNDLPPLRGKRLIVMLVVNVENWSFDRPMPRKVLTAPHGAEKVPDVPNYCWAEHGMRKGMARFLELFGRLNLPINVSINASVIDSYPLLANAMLAADWEFIGHGMTQTIIEEGAAEREFLGACKARIERFTGTPMRGWLSPGLRENPDTPDHLAELGVEYVFDWGLDDVPLPMTVKRGQLTALPYTLEINDSIVYAVEKHASGEMLERLDRALAVYRTECQHGTHILGIGLHPHLLGTAHRIGELTAMVERLAADENVTFAYAAQVQDWFNAAALPRATASNLAPATDLSASGVSQ